MRALLIICVALFSSFAATATSEQLRLAWVESRPVNFSSSDREDLLKIVVAGETCKDLRIWAAVETQDGQTLDVWSFRGSRLFTDAGDCIDSQDIVAEFLKPMKYASLPSPEDLADDPSFGSANLTAIEEVRRRQLPLLCLKAGKSYADCFAFIDGQSTKLFSTGS